MAGTAAVLVFALGQTGRAEKDREEEEGSIAVGVERGYIPVQDKPNAIWEASDAALSTSKTILESKETT